MANWIVLVVVGILIYISTYAPVFPSAWETFAQAVGGVLVLVGLVIFVLGLLGIGVGRRNR